MDRNCILASATENEIRKIANELQKFRWIYFGEDISKVFFIEKLVGEKGTKIETGERLQKIAVLLKKKYVDYIGKISLQRNSLEWWASSFSEKSPYSSKTFLNSCYLRMFLEIVKECDGESVVFFVENRSLRKAIKRNNPNGMEIKYEENKLRELKEKVVKTKDYLARKGYFLINNIYKIILSKYVYKMQDQIDKNGPYEVVHTYANRCSFDFSTQKFRESFYGGLFEYAKRKNKRVLLFPSIWSTDYKQAMEILKKTGGVFFIPHAFLSLTDVLNVFLRTLRKPKLNVDRFEGMDIREIIEEDRNRDYSELRMPSDMLNYYAIKNMSKKGILISRFVDHYENHTSEKVIRIATKEFYPKAKLIGYQHSTFSSMHLEYLFSEKEFSILPFPDYIVTNGEIDKELFLGMGYPKERLVRGGAVRYEYLLSSKVNYRRLNKEKPTILVTTSINKPDALELMFKVINAFGKEECKGYKVSIKCHPFMPFEKIRKELNLRIPENFEVSEVSIPQLIEQADILIYTSSTTSLEAIAQGVPIIYVHSDLMIELDPLDFNRNIAFCARSPEEILEGVSYFLNMSEQNLDKKRKEWRGIVEKMFLKVDDSVYSLFLEEP